MERILKYSAIALVVVLVGTLAYGLGVTRNLPVAAAGTSEAGATRAAGEFAILDEAFKTLKAHYVDPNAVDYPPLREAAITGMLSALGDRELVYIPAERYKLDRNGFEGSFQGIGATVANNAGRITIVSPIRDSPAEKAGIRAGDVILKIGDESAEGIALADAVAKIRGPKGSKVKLTLVRQGDTRPYEVEIVRDDIKTQSVYVREVADTPGVFQIAISQFTDRTDDEIKDELARLKNQNVKGLILDLRNNPGGLLKETVAVASQFMPENQVVLREVGRSGQEKVWTAERGAQAATLPIVILMNQGSASGSEVLAGALQDNGRATIVGTQSYGKGTVNQVHEISDGSALYIPIARWFTPKGRQIEGVGLKPDVEIALSDADVRNQNDVQFQRALDILKAKI